MMSFSGCKFHTLILLNFTHLQWLIRILNLFWKDHWTWPICILCCSPGGFDSRLSCTSARLQYLWYELFFTIISKVSLLDHFSNKTSVPPKYVMFNQSRTNAVIYSEMSCTSSETGVLLFFTFFIDAFCLRLPVETNFMLKDRNSRGVKVREPLFVFVCDDTQICQLSQTPRTPTSAVLADGVFTVHVLVWHTQALRGFGSNLKFKAQFI